MQKDKPLDPCLRRDRQEKLEILRHSTAHIMAAAVLKFFPEAKFAIGPAIENGFYYDFELPRTLIPEDLALIEAEMKKIIKANFPFEQKQAPAKEALEKFKKLGQKYKVELIEDLMKEGEKQVSLYKLDGFVDLCSGPHKESSGEIDPQAFKLTHISGSYWKGDEKRESLQRIYGTVFENKANLKKHLFALEEAKKRDHKKLGKQLELFTFHKEGPGFAFWHPKGMTLRSALMKPYEKLLKKAGYQTLSTPIILNEEMWRKSGHWDNYKDNMYFTKIDDKDFAIKPMNCPGTIIIYKSRPHSYREFPIKYDEKGEVHRHEPSGTLNGLFRVRAFRQDDAHIFTQESQIEKEIKDVIKLILDFYKFFDFKEVNIELSTRPEKSIGSDEIWEQSEKILKRVLESSKLNYDLNEGDGAFYGPKIDFHIKDSLGRSWQCGTVQLDFAMPERYELEYVDKDGKIKRPVMIHRTIMGSIQRFVGILIEHYGGAFPTWLAPVQVALLPVSEKFEKYSKKVEEALQKEGIRIESPSPENSLGKRIAESTELKIPYILIMGEKEEKEETVTVRKRGQKEQETLEIEDFVKMIKKEIEKKA